MKKNIDEMGKKDYIELINKEIKWCKENKKPNMDSTRDWISGFIKGLEQAKFLIKQKPKVKGE